jgi:RNA polymerase sigma factor (sigma-70 family)
VVGWCDKDTEPWEEVSGAVCGCLRRSPLARLAVGRSTIGNRDRHCGKLEVVERSFEQVFKVEYRPLRGYVYRRLGSSAADEIAAETFAVAYRRWGDLDPARPVRPWLYGIAANLLRHYWRKERRMLRAYARAGLDPVYQQDEEESVERADARAQKRVLAAALAELRPVEREILLLHAWAYLTDAEIAEALSLPIGTVKSRLHRAREQMENHLRASGQVEVNDLTPTAEQ